MATSKKHYEKVAKALSEEYAILGDGKSLTAEMGRSVIKAVVLRLAMIYAEENPRFDANRFIAATGVMEEVKV